MLRESGSRLPVEVWSKDEADESAEWCAELVKEGMVCRRLADYLDPEQLRHPYQWKVFTMMFASFEEMLFLDADSIPVRNPDGVFDAAVYRDNGVLLWRDYWKHSGSPWLPYLIGINSTKKSDELVKEESIESGQMYWNKKTHWKSLLLAAYYNFYGPEFWYTVFNNGWAGWGDKDTFAMACKATGEGYFQIPHALVTGFVSNSSHGIAMIQADPTVASEHAPMFFHANIIKWGIKEFMCTENCRQPDDGRVGRQYRIDDDSDIKDQLSQHRRVYSVSSLFERGIDPEPLMWKVLERVACRSSRGDAHLCKNTREHAEKTFGYRFLDECVDECGKRQRDCVRGPWYAPSRAKPKPETWTKDTEYEDSF
ncbi:hypothetical protein LLEC1_02680 [Akanthomyces lecanii]|uniref:Uncharacterized protein n=1 Tax=Cordyceps confragosa TaxID=2714763 RepID=A0A179I7B1_CORDF|nr:hypothetical protein LLEC1_02680 [Akanthomyces lecanii]